MKNEINLSALNAIVNDRNIGANNNDSSTAHASLKGLTPNTIKSDSNQNNAKFNQASQIIDKIQPKIDIVIRESKESALKSLQESCGNAEQNHNLQHSDAQTRLLNETIGDGGSTVVLANTTLNDSGLNMVNDHEDTLPHIEIGNISGNNINVEEMSPSLTRNTLIQPSDAFGISPALQNYGVERNDSTATNLRTESQVQQSQSQNFDMVEQASPQLIQTIMPIDPLQRSSQTVRSVAHSQVTTVPVVAAPRPHMVTVAKPRASEDIVVADRASGKELLEITSKDMDQLLSSTRAIAENPFEKRNQAEIEAKKALTATSGLSNSTVKTRVSTTKPLVLKNCSIGEFISNITEEHREIKCVLLEEKRIFDAFSGECREEITGLRAELTTLQSKLREARDTLEKLKRLRREQVESTEKLLKRFRSLREITSKLDDSVRITTNEVETLRKKVTETEEEVDSMRAETTMRKRAHSTTQGASEMSLHDLEQDVERIHAHSAQALSQHEALKTALVQRLSVAEVELKSTHLEIEAVRSKGFEADRNHQRQVADLKAQREFEAGEKAALVQKLVDATDLNKKLQRVTARRGATAN